MIDIHCHILPELDDGAADMQEALAMARRAEDSGVAGIVATPHFLGKPESLEGIGLLLARHRSLRGAISKAGIRMALYLGAEILCLPETVKMARQQLLPTLGQTNYLLCEFGFRENRMYMNRLLQAIAACGYRIVVAHPERYEAVQRDPRVAEQWFARGYVIQVNKDSLLGTFGSRVQQTAQLLLEQGLVHLIASDAHDSLCRTTDMSQIRDWLKDNCPAEYSRILLEENPARLIRGEKMVPEV